MEGRMKCKREAPSSVPLLPGAGNLSPHPLLGTTTEQIRQGDKATLTAAVTARQALSLTSVYTAALSVWMETPLGTVRG